MGEDSNKEKLNSKLKNALSDMAQNTGMHGLPNVTGRKQLYKKIFWLLVLLAALCVMIWQIVDIMTKYFSYPVSTTTGLVFKSELDFPAVTFCNLNPVRLSASADVSTNMQSIMSMGSIGKPPRPGGNGATGSEYTSERDDYEIKQNFTGMFLAMNASHRISVGHKIEDMLIDCSWRGITCGPDNFTLFNNWHYGNCYTFNTGLQQAIQTSHDSGPLAGLTLRLYVQSMDYVDALSTSLGVKMVVHNQSAMPFPENEGLLVPSGSYSQIGVKTVYISREDPPHGKCVNYTIAEAAAKTAYTNVLLSTEYSRQGCINTCIQREIMTICGCASAKYPTEGSAYTGVDSTYKVPCDWTNDTLQSCVTTQERIGHRDCTSWLKCPDRCVDLQYPAIVTQSHWPTDAEQVKAITDLTDLAINSNDTALDNKLKNMTDPGEKLTFISQNVLIVQVFFEDLSYLSYVTSESYSVADMLSGLGGSAGLWLGISVCTIFELFEFLLDLIVMCSTKCSKKGKVEDRDPSVSASDQVPEKT